MDLDAVDHWRRDARPERAEPQASSAHEQEKARAALEAIADHLLARIVASPALNVEFLSALFEDAPPALTAFDMSEQEGRQGFLWALFHHHYRNGLLMAVNHVWASLARPRAVRCQVMAQRLKRPGTGKVALKNVLAAFLEEALYGVDFPPLPDLSGYPDSAAWHAACQQHFAIIDAKFEAIVGRYEAVLDGREPDGAAAADVEINGPSLAAADRKRPKSAS